MGQNRTQCKKNFCGHKDTSINPTGEEQATKLGHYLRSRGIHFDKVVSSDLKRCRQTTALVLKHSKQENVPTSYTSGLRERYMGVIEGMQITEAEKALINMVKAPLEILGKKSDDFVARLTGCV
nr:AEL_HP1_G0051640.mRNA.1.CDS.1 [Saccharomyces cerevisiae]